MYILYIIYSSRPIILVFVLREGRCGRIILMIFQIREHTSHVSHRRERFTLYCHKAVVFLIVVINSAEVTYILKTFLPSYARLISNYQECLYSPSVG